MVKASGTQSSGIVRLVHHKACCLLCMQVYEKSLRRGDARCTSNIVKCQIYTEVLHLELNKSFATLQLVVDRVVSNGCVY